MYKYIARGSSLLSLVAILALLPCAGSLADEISAGNGLIVFTREAKFAGKAIRFNINVDGIPKVQLLSGSRVELPVPAGSHTFSVRTPSLDGQDALTINVKEGWTYHVEAYVLLGWPTGRPKLKLVSQTAPAAGAVQSESVTALAGPLPGQVTAPPASGTQPARSDDESGRLGLRNFVGEWSFEMWSLASDGSRLEGRGIAEASAETSKATRVYITEFSAPAFPTATGGGQLRISYEPDKGFSLESLLQDSGERLQFSGRYEADTGRYVFQPIDGAGQSTTGIASNSTRVEIQSVDLGAWVVDTYSSLDGQSVKMQSFRFSRR